MTSTLTVGAHPNLSGGPVSKKSILGIDPGIANTGWAVVDEDYEVVRSGVIRTYSRWSTHRRIQVIHDAILQVVESLEPVGVVCEGFTFRGGGRKEVGQFIRSAVSTGAATGAAISACGDLDVDIVAAHAWRARIGVVAGRRKETREVRKERARMAVEAIVGGLPPCPDHVVDAIGLALYALVGTRALF